MARGKRIRTLKGLMAAVKARKAVIVPAVCGVIPAAIAINFIGSMLLRYFRDGMYIYKKGE